MWHWFAELDPNLQTAITVIVVATMTNVACALLGCFLVLRRMSLLGDALAHAVLPGLVIAFVFTGTLSLPAMFLGAVAIGVLTALLTEGLHRQAGVSEDASLGVVFTSLFALGVILIKRYGQDVDLDPDCVLNGMLEMVDDNVWQIGGFEVPRALVTILPVLILNLLFVVVFWKELLLGSFDPALATAMGFRAGLLHYTLMCLVALTTVAAFEQVGSILVVAMLIVPAATAHLCSDRLHIMLWLAAGFGALSALVGYAAALIFDVNTAGAMAVSSGIFYGAALFFSPRYGWVSRWLHQAALRLRIIAEDILGMIYRAEEWAAGRRLQPAEVFRGLGGGVWVRVVLSWLAWRDMIRRQPEGLELSPAGRLWAAAVVRSHRLWESYLVRHLGLPDDHVHEPAMRVEHYIEAPLQEQLAGALGAELLDPHGRPIPQLPAESESPNKDERQDQP